MNGAATRFLRLGLSLAGLVTLGWVLTGQAAKPVRHSVPTDWSHRHLIFSHPRSPEVAARVSEDPRYLQQVYRRQQRLALPAVAEADAQTAQIHSRLKVMSRKLHRDWSKDLGTSGTVGAGNYPAKFSFDTTVAFCDVAPTPDYVVFSTGLAGAANQASVVAYDNMYFGCNPGPNPRVYWAYNTGGTIKTSPVLSRTGSQVAFVQTTVGVGSVVVLKWARGGTVILPTPLVPVAPALYSACVAPCMTLIPLLAGGGIIPTDDTTSAVYYDYSSDVAWVGDASGWLHKITGLFNGTPTEVTAGGFPLHLNGGTPLSSPVYDRVSNNVFVADASFLYRVDATVGGSAIASGQLDFGVGIVEGPIVDSGKGLVYVFASADQSGGCSGGLDCAAVYQLITTFAGTTTGTEVTIGQTAVLGPNSNPTYIGGFDSAYYNSNNATGALYVCGNTGANPILYQVPIVAGAMPGQGQIVAPLTATSSTAACSPVTDIPNENIPVAGVFSERIFVSVQGDGLSSACAASGCILNFLDTPWQPFTSYALGQQVLSSKQRIETVIQAGISAGVAPNWSTSPANLDTDGNPGTQVVWIDQGTFSAAFLTWQPSNAFVVPKIKILDSNKNVQILTTTGTTGSVQPTWNTTPGLTTPDNNACLTTCTAVWTNVGPIATFALPAAGGTSGIIVDNTVGSFTVVGGSQIYFSTLNDDACGGGCAVQASQPGLN